MFEQICASLSVEQFIKADYIQPPPPQPEKTWDREANHLTLHRSHAPPSLHITSVTVSGYWQQLHCVCRHAVWAMARKSTRRMRDLTQLMCRLAKLQKNSSFPWHKIRGSRNKKTEVLYQGQFTWQKNQPLTGDLWPPHVPPAHVTTHKHTLAHTLKNM